MVKPFVRKVHFDRLWRYLHGTPNFLQVVSGPRQVGKSTLAWQIHGRWGGPKRYASADELRVPDHAWIRERWLDARTLAHRGKQDVLLVLDEVQKIPGWSDAVKALWDEDRHRKTRLRVVLLGSSALLVQRGLTESLAGRFELHRHPHWSYVECHTAFGLSLDAYWRFGGYPAALAMRKDPARWARYIRDTIVETVVGRDVLLMSPVTKPALLRQVFGLACGYPAEILSLQKMLGQLAEAGNATTVAHHLHLLSAAYLITPLPRWSGSILRQRGSIPKLILRDNGLSTAMVPPPLIAGRLAPPQRGRLIENAVGAALVTLAERTGAELFYWRDRDQEVDFIYRHGSRMIAIEVKSGSASEPMRGLRAFRSRVAGTTTLVIGSKPAPDADATVSLEQFFLAPAQSLGVKES